MPSILYMCAILHTILKYCKTKASPKLNFLLFAIFVFYWDQAFHALQLFILTSVWQNNRTKIATILQQKKSINEGEVKLL